MTTYTFTVTITGGGQPEVVESGKQVAADDAAAEAAIKAIFVGHTFTSVVFVGATITMACTRP